MAKKSEPPYFAVLCGDRDLEQHLTVCMDSGFHLVRGPALGFVRVHDRDTVLLDAVSVAGGAWLVRLHDQYYRHPFLGPPSGGDAMPGVP